MTTTEWISVAGVVATLLAVLVALFKDEFWRWWRRPDLMISIASRPPDCHICKTDWRDSSGTTTNLGDWYYLRLWVYNEGDSPAENVNVFAAKLFKSTTPNNYIEVREFLPMNLLWAHSHEPFRARIPPGMGRHCDLGHIADPRTKGIHGETRPDIPDKRTILCLELEAKPLTLIHLLPPGVYRLDLIVAADNAKPKNMSVRIDLTGDWFETEEEMFSQGVLVSTMRP